jgi:hypothetical protein|tara:strand:+ start:2854 stop:2973 length:120 start_codon:yes stop_codon:yes gene_type:complete
MDKDEWFEHCRFIPLDQAVRYVGQGYIIEEENEENTDEE